jgi:hypothetical protein
MAAFVRENSLNPLGRMGLYPICLYVDDDMAAAAGREVYGFPKEMARIELGTHEMSLIRCGLAPQSAPRALPPIEVMSAHWSAKPQAGGSLPPARPGRAARTARLPIALPFMARLAQLMLFYNTRHMAQPGAPVGAGSGPGQLTKAALTDVQICSVSALHNLRLLTDVSVNDPVCLPMQADGTAAEMRAARGIRVELAFSLGTARNVCTVQGPWEGHALGPILRDGR